MTFAAALPVILAHEGLWSDHPSDPGGATMRGVTKRTWEAWVDRSVTKAQLRQLTVADVAPLYKARYWDAVRGDDLPPAVALVAFDMAVNAGPSRAARMLQETVGVMPADGVIGPRTLASVATFARGHGVAEIVRAYSNRRRAYYRSLKTFSTFGRGWLRRVTETETAALKMVG